MREEKCKGIRALSAESCRTVTPACYESALRLKYARGDISSRSNDYVSLVTSRLPAAGKNLAEIIKTFKGE